jgi:hypothetical protein
VKVTLLMDVTKCHTKSGVGIDRKLLELWSNKQLTEVTRAEIVSMYRVEGTGNYPQNQLQFK